jgi:hypothetical protein
VSKDDFDALQISHAALEAQLACFGPKLQPSNRVLTPSSGSVQRMRRSLTSSKRTTPTCMRLTLSFLTDYANQRPPLLHLRSGNRLVQQRSHPAAVPSPSAEQRIEQLLRAANACKVVVFPRGAITTAAEVCTKLQTAASLPAYATSGAVQAGSVWIVSLVSRTFALQVLTRWYSFYQLTRWGVDQALTHTQLAERATNKPRFMELKAARAFPRWHGSEIYVRMKQGVRPASQWNPQMALDPRPASGGPPPAAAANPNPPPTLRPPLLPLPRRHLPPPLLLPLTVLVELVVLGRLAPALDPSPLPPLAALALLQPLQLRDPARPSKQLVHPAGYALPWPTCRGFCWGCSPCRRDYTSCPGPLRA